MEKMNKRKVILFTVLTLVFATVVTVAVSLISLGIEDPIKAKKVFQAGMVGAMFIPLIMALVVKADFRGMGWKPQIRGNVRWIIFSLVVPMLLVAIGAAIFFLIFPDLFDPKGSYMMEDYRKLGLDLEAQLEASGMTYGTYVLVSLIGCMTYLPFVNMFAAIGEEIGWRGFLYPELRKGFGRVKTWVIGGVIWGAFHFGAILAGGYEYGFDYIGAPVLGPIVFTIFCVSLGVLHEIIYDRTKCIWFPALFHGSFNAAATMVLCVMSANDPEKLSKYMILGPASNGLIAGIPIIITAVILGAYVIRKDRSAGSK
ncbi:MAG: CPBP family intramembrane metalloprotease [Eubacterium sp.]|nr:CPBP family intramembrane metalloprotease [Eubacterium sp.]